MFPDTTCVILKGKNGMHKSLILFELPKGKGSDQGINAKLFFNVSGFRKVVLKHTCSTKLGGGKEFLITGIEETEVMIPCFDHAWNAI